ncbi:5-formyltetrahydrofolate cyclo-ligase [Corynebacterium hindlerae]|uniref:5-formyltetrahydrofolate cyclo-ligase n=1 Tax=Corynebacterium hindlerae TaxID=699041 RepID=UPI0031B6786B
MTIATEKTELRRRLFDVRRSLTPDSLASFNAALHSRIAEFLTQHGYTSVAAYMPTRTEPGGEDLVSFLLSVGVSVIIPVAHEDFSMSWHEVTPHTTFRKGAFGISEPVGSPLPGSPLTQVDVIFVPALAADAAGYRLGKGGGYYDRALEAVAHPVTAALVFSHELLPHVPREPHDALTHAIITPEKTLVTDGTF